MVMEKLTVTQFIQEIGHENYVYNVKSGDIKTVLLSFKECSIVVKSENIITLFKVDTGMEMDINLSVVDEIVKEDRTGIFRLQLSDGLTDILIKPILRIKL